MPSNNISGVAARSPVRGEWSLRTIENSSTNPEVVLWRNVIFLALKDLACDGTGATAQRQLKASTRAQAVRSWVGSRDFLEVCDHANLHHEQVGKIVASIEAMIREEGNGLAFLKRGAKGSLGAINRAAREAKEGASPAAAVPVR